MNTPYRYFGVCFAYLTKGSERIVLECLVFKKKTVRCRWVYKFNKDCSKYETELTEGHALNKQPYSAFTS